MHTMNYTIIQLKIFFLTNCYCNFYFLASTHVEICIQEVDIYKVKKVDLVSLYS